MTKPILVIALTCATLLGAVCGCGDTAPNPIDLGWKAFKEGKRDAALDLFRSAIHAEPDNVDAHRAYQTAMIDMGRYLDLKREYRAALDAHKREGLAYFLFLSISDDFPENKALLREGLRVDPNNRWLLWLDGIYRVNELSTHGQPEKALELLEGLPYAMQDRFTYHMSRATLLMVLNRQWEALLAADAAVKVSPFSLEGYSARSAVHYRNADFSASTEDLRQANALGDFAIVHMELGSILWNQGRIAEAKAEFRRAVDSPRDPTGWACCVGAAYSYLNDNKRAQEHYELALKLAPEDASAQAAIATLKIYDGRVDEAERMARDIVRQYPRDENGYRALGAVEMWRGHYAEAAGAYAKALEFSPKDISILVGRGLALLSSGQTDEAEATIQQAQRWAPDSPEVLRALAHCAFSRGRYDEAVEGYRRVLRVLPEDTTSSMGMAAAHLQLKHYDEARNAYTAALGAASTDEDRKTIRKALEELEGAMLRTSHPVVTVAYQAAKTLDNDRLLAYETTLRRVVGTPWNGARAVYRSSETATYMDTPQWSLDGRMLYFTNGDLSVLDLRRGLVRTVIRRPPGKISVHYWTGGGPRSLRAYEFLNRWWCRFKYRYDFPGSRDRSVEQVRLSRDGGLLYFSVDVSSGDRVLTQLEAVRTDGTQRRVIFPFHRRMWRFEYDRPRDRLVVWARGELSLIDPHSGSEKLVSSDAGYSHDTSFSPDGREMVLASVEEGDESEISILDLETGKRRGLGVNGQHPAWSPDGRKIAFIHQDSELRLFDVKSGRLESIHGQLQRDPGNSEVAGRMSRGATWSPDSRFIAYSLGYMKDPRSRRTWPLVTLIADLKRREVWQAPDSLENPSWAPHASKMP